MRKPNVDMWCERFVRALVKNLPKIDTFLTGDDVYRLAMDHVKRAIYKAYKRKGGDQNEEAREEAGGQACCEARQEELRLQEVSD